ncbi:MAG: DEAD/DEAH box helicase [Polyangiaceae bacterium]
MSQSLPETDFEAAAGVEDDAPVSSPISGVPVRDPFDGVPEPLRAAFEQRGFSSLTEVQRAVLDADSPGRNLRISSQTGSGKTVALGIVLANELLEPAPGRSGPEALVITPTRELANQVAEELSWLFSKVRGVDVACVTGGTEVWKDKKPLAKKPRILVGTPGRLNDHLTSGVLSADSVRHVVLDEADQMLDMGFKDELDAIVGALPDERRSHLVSATFPPAVKALADRFQKNALHVAGTELGQANQDIEHIAHLVRRGESYNCLVNLLLMSQGERTLIFVERRVDAQELAEMLAGDGFAALHLSGDLAQAQRTRTLNAFKAGVISTLICTDVAARGIDVPDIARVIHMGLSNDPDVYTHRSGRTGRAGRKGQSVLIVPMTAERRIRRLLHSAGIDCNWRPGPSAEKVYKAITKQTRTRMFELLQADPVEGERYNEAELEYARGLLSDRDPAELVATLIKLAEPALPREPFPLGKADPRAGGFVERDRTPRAQSYVPFFINWGERGGANTARVIAHVCRRGGIKGQSIGAVRVEARMSVFEVASDVAQAFEIAARKPDAREPNLRVERFKGAVPAAPERRKGPPSFGSRRAPAPRSAADGRPFKTKKRTGARHH